MNWPWIIACVVGGVVALSIVRADWKAFALFPAAALVLEFYGLAANLSGGVSMEDALWLNDLDFERGLRFSVFLVLGHGVLVGLVAGIVVKGARLAGMRKGVPTNDA